MGRRGGSRGRSRGRSSSRGKSRSKSRSRSRSSSRKSSRRKSSTSSRRSTSRGRKTTSRTKGRATKRTTRTRTTRSAPARRAATRTSRATPRRVNRTVVKRTRTISPPRPRLTGGRIGLTRRRAGTGNPRSRVATPRNITTTPNRMVRSAFDARTSRILSQQQRDRTGLFAQQKASNIAGAPVTVTYANGKKQTMRLSTSAIQQYQRMGLKVSPVTQTQTGFNPMATISNWFQPTQTAHASPQIPRIQNKSPPWFANPPKQLHVNAPMYAKPNTRTNSNFGGLGANPWNPVEALGGLFGMSPQEKPQSQYLPQQQNTQSTGYPTYTAMAQGQYQEQAFAESPQGFQSTMLGSSSFEPMDTIKNLATNQYVIIGGLAIGALIILKIVMGMGGGGRGGGGGKTVIL